MPHGDNKPFCSNCPIHCYKPEMRQQMRAVMQYAGPRMLLSNPILVLRHMAKPCEGKEKRPCRINSFAPVRRGQTIYLPRRFVDAHRLFVQHRLCSLHLCYGLHLLLIDAKVSLYLLPFTLGAQYARQCAFLLTIRAATVRDSRAQREEKPAGTAVRKLLRLGVRETKTSVKMAGLTTGHGASSSWICTIPLTCRSFLRHALAAAACFASAYSSTGAWRRCCWPACR